MAGFLQRVFVGLVLGGALAAPVLWTGSGGTAHAQAGTTQTPPPAPGRGQALPPVGTTALILGQVVDAATGEPLADVVVSPGARGGGAGPRGAGPAVPAATLQPVVTGADGRFVFRNLPPGAYPVRASLSGYVDGMVGQGRPGGPDRQLELADGERIGDAKIRLWKQGSITGTVLDEAGEPAVDLTVQAYRRLTVDGRPQLAAGAADRAQTDDRGRFRFASLTPGDYIVAVPLTQSTMPAAVFDALVTAMLGESQRPPEWFVDLMMSGAESMFMSGTPVRVGDLLWNSSFPGATPPSENGRATGYRTTYYPAATSPAEASVVSVLAGQERTAIDLRLSLVPMYRVSGTVVGETGPMANLAVRLLSATADPVVAGAGGAVTRADGGFTLIGIPPGQYVLHVVKAARSASVMRMLAGEGAAPPDAPSTSVSTTIFAEQPVSVGNADVTGLSLLMRDGPKISGRVEFDLTPPKTAGQVTQGTGVTITPVGGGTGFAALGGAEPATLDADGRFKTPGYEPGRYTIGFGRGGRGSVSVKSITANGRDVTNAALELRDVDVDVVIKASDRFGAISGVARVSNGLAAQTATVIVMPADYRALAASGLLPTRVRTVAASRSGAYAVTDLVAGDYLIAAMDDAEVSDNQDAAFFDAVARVATRITLGDAQKASQDLILVRTRR